MNTNQTRMTPEQDAALQAILDGKKVFLVGPSGSGKNTVLNEAAARLKEKGIAVGLCSLSRIGAMHINGESLHSFFKLPLDLFSDDTLCVPDITLLCRVQVLMVNYIQTCTPPFIDILWKALQLASEKGHTVQVVFSGDPLGLNSVMDVDDWKRYEALTDIGLNSKSPFLSRHWDDFGLMPYELTTDIRHQNTAASLCLEELRFGKPDGIRRLEMLSSRRPIEGGIWICSNSSQAHVKNNELSDSFPGVSHTFRADVHGKVSMADSPLLPALVLKENMPIIIVLNLPAKRLTSGMVGKIVTIHGEKIYAVFPNRKGRVLLEKQKWEDPRLGGTVIQFPLDAGFAVTVYKARQMNLQCANLCGRFSQPGQLYSAVSRVQSLDRLFIDHKLSPKESKTDFQVRRWYFQTLRKTTSGSTEAILPRTSIPYGCRHGMRFGIKNINFRSLGFSRSLICLMDAKTKRTIWITDYSRYIQLRKKKRNVHNGLGDSAYFVTLFLNYAFIDGPERINALSDITAGTIQHFLKDYALGLYGKPNATHTDKTIDRCIDKTFSFLLAILNDKDITTSFTYEELFTKKQDWSNRQRSHEITELAFSIPYNSTDHKTLRDMPPEVVQEMVSVAYEKYPMLLASIALGLCGGLRPSETCCLSLDNIRLLYTENELSWISIDLENTVSLREDDVEVGKVKVPRCATIQNMYLRLFDLLFISYLIWRGNQECKGKTRPLCIDTRGNAMTYRTLLYHFKKLLDMVVHNLKDSRDPRTICFIDDYLKEGIGAHILRHIFTESLVHAGYEVSDIMNARGDKNPLSASHYLQNKGFLIEKQNKSVTALTDLMMEVARALDGKG